jgi:F-type H+-transporting ATPase subunit b
MEIFKNFGVEPMLFIAQIVNFLIIFYVLKRFLYKPILSMLKNRESTIKAGLEQAEEARVLLDQASQKEKEILKKAQSEARVILSDAKKQSDEMLQASEQKTRLQADRLLKEAREQISFETKEAEGRMTANISNIAIHFLEKSLSEVFSKNEQDLIMSHALKNIKKKAD